MENSNPIHVNIPREAFKKIYCLNCGITPATFLPVAKLFVYPGGLLSAQPVIVQVPCYRCVDCNGEMSNEDLINQAKVGPPFKKSNSDL